MDSTPNMDALLHLLKCSSKKKVSNLCKEVISMASKSSVVESIKAELEIQDNESDAVYTALEHLIKYAIYNGADEVKLVKNYFPPDFHSDLSNLLANIIAENYSEWRKLTLSDQVSLPKLQDFSWKLQNENSGISPKCVVQLKTSGHKPQEVTFSKEDLDTLLDSLSGLREQISSISQS